MNAIDAIFGRAFAATQAAADAHGAATGGHAAKGVFPPFDPSSFASQLLWLGLSFGAFYLLMSRVAIPRIASILEVRRDRISRDLDEAQRLKEEADAAQAAYEHELAQARARAQSIARDAQDKTRAAADEEKARLEAGLAARLADAEARIAAIRGKALGEVGRIAGEAAGAIVRELTGKPATPAEIDDALSRGN
jgi:F-type H+-transporting ATPase subunit b